MEPLSVGDRVRYLRNHTIGEVAFVHPNGSYILRLPTLFAGFRTVTTTREYVRKL